MSLKYYLSKKYFSDYRQFPLVEHTWLNTNGVRKDYFRATPPGTSTSPLRTEAKQQYRHPNMLQSNTDTPTYCRVRVAPPGTERWFWAAHMTSTGEKQWTRFSTESHQDIFFSSNLFERQEKTHRWLEDTVREANRMNFIVFMMKESHKQELLFDPFFRWESWQLLLWDPTGGIPPRANSGSQSWELTLPYWQEGNWDSR